MGGSLYQTYSKTKAMNKSYFTLLINTKKGFGSFLRSEDISKSPKNVFLKWKGLKKGDHCIQQKFSKIKVIDLVLLFTLILKRFFVDLLEGEIFPEVLKVGGLKWGGLKTGITVSKFLKNESIR